MINRIKIFDGGNFPKNLSDYGTKIQALSSEYSYLYLYRPSREWINEWTVQLEDEFSTINFHLTDKMKRSFFQAAVMLILLYGCTTWTLTEWMEKKLDGNYTRMLQAMLNKSWRQHPTKQQVYGHLTPVMKTIKVRWTRHAGHCWRSGDELINDVLLWTPHGWAKARRPVRTYIQQLCDDTGYSPEDLPEAMNDREGWRERTRDIRVDGMTRWWWDDINSNLLGWFYSISTFLIIICWG